ncbi:MAG: ribosomal protein S18-alanine N-acetyltransferase [Clostridiales bacterium]|nr:ribosomal protein S18-alanine N-acetyltransferase [Clostridiales bacterium]
MTDFFEIVPTDMSHISEIAEIEKICFSDPWSYETLAAETKNDNAHFLTAFDGKKVLGYIGVGEVCGECYISNVAVLPEYRRKGIGRALISAAEDGAEKRGCDFITLEVRESNMSAISLYLKAGFRAVGIRKDYYSHPTENALIMTKYFQQKLD